MKIFMFAASMRKGSFNKKFIHNAHGMIPSDAYDISFKEFNNFSMPLYDGDLESQSGIPKAGQDFIDEIKSADIIIISTPEYNAGIPGTLKNAIDWSSRSKENPWAGKQVLLIGASPGKLGAVRSLWHCRQTLETQSAHIYPDMMGLSAADKAFDENDKLIDGKTAEALQKLINKFLAYAKIKHE